MAVVTELVVTVKEPEVPPPLTVTLGGTLATAELLLVSETAAPPLGAGALKVTVPLELLPPATAVGLRVNADNEAGCVAGPLPVCTL